MLRLSKIATKGLGYLILACSSVICTGTGLVQSNKAIFIPSGWAHDYNYQDNVFGYLKENFERYESLNKPVYAYIFDEKDPHCKHVRRLMGSEKLGRVMKDVKVIMLDKNRLEELYLRDRENNLILPDFGPFFAKIARNGGVTNHIIFPDIYLYHPEKIPEKRLRKMLVKRTYNIHSQAKTGFFETEKSNPGLGAPLPPLHFYSAVTRYFSQKNDR